MKFKKSQAAMEFLMTYGWAILVVLVVIGALAYFGVLNPAQFLPARCTFNKGTFCTDHKISSAGGFSVVISNNLGHNIELENINFTASTNSVNAYCNNSGTWQAAEPHFPDQSLFVLAGSTRTISTPACKLAGYKVGERLKGIATLKYTDMETNFVHELPGAILVDIE